MSENVVSIELKQQEEQTQPLEQEHEQENDKEKEKVLVRAEFDSQNICRLLTYCSFGIMMLSILFISVLNYVVFAVFCAVAVVLSSFGLYISNGTLRARLYITDKYVYSKALFGNIEMMPIEKIEYISVSYFNSISIKTDNNRIAQHFVKNRDEVAQLLKDMMIK